MLLTSLMNTCDSHTPPSALGNCSVSLPQSRSDPTSWSKMEQGEKRENGREEEEIDEVL